MSLDLVGEVWFGCINLGVDKVFEVMRLGEFIKGIIIERKGKRFRVWFMRYCNV